MRKSLLLTVSLLAVLIIVAGCPNKAPRIPAKPSGPALVKFGNTATYVSMTTDPNRDKVLYAFDWGDGTADTTALIKSGDTITQSHAWSAIGVYPVKVIAKDEKGKWSADWSDTLMVTVDSLNPPPNVPPYAPTIVAKHTPLRGIAGGPAYRFYATARDEYDDSLYYRWYFDGTDSVTSPLFPSFTEGYATWTPTGDTHTYTVQVRVFDQTGLTNDSLATTTFKTVAEGEIIWGYEAEFVTSPAIGTTHWEGNTWPAIICGSTDDDEGLCVFDAYQSFLVNQFSVPDPEEYNSSATIGDDGTRYVGNENGGFYAFSTDDSRGDTFNWRFGTSDSGMTATAALGNDGGIYCGGEDQYIHKLIDNGASATEVWSYPLRRDMTSSPAIGADGTIYCCDYDGYAYALNENGTLRWQVRAADTLGITSSPAIASDGTVYVCAEDGRLLAIRDGSIAWLYEVTPWRPISSSPIIGPDGNIYFGCDDGRLYRIDQNSHMPVADWPITVSLRAINSTPLLCADNIIYVAGDDSLYAYDIDNPTGGPRWVVAMAVPSMKGSGHHRPRRLSLDNQPSAVVDRYGIIYISTWSGYGGIFAIAGRLGGTLAATDWPMFHHDVRHTGRFGAR